MDFLSIIARFLLIVINFEPRVELLNPRAAILIIITIIKLQIFMRKFVIKFRSDSIEVIIIAVATIIEKMVIYSN